MSHLALHPFFILILLFGSLNPGQSAVPLHDDLEAAEAIASLPFNTTLDLSGATLQPDEPQTCMMTDRTVWYSFTPSETTVVLADTLGSPNLSISIYEAFEPGMTGLVFVQCAIPTGVATFQAQAGQTYYIQVGAVVGEASTVQFSLSEVAAITGRVIAAVTETPLPGNQWPFTWVDLYRVCGPDCLEYVSGTAANAEGQFWFDGFFTVSPGTYVVRVMASLYPPEQFGPFEFTGENLDLGDLALDPLPKIRSIRGRLLDKATGNPIPDAFGPVVYLYRCQEGVCSEYVNSQVPDHNGRFNFETDGYGNPLPAGTYQIQVYADQYEWHAEEFVEVGEGQRRNLGDLRLRSLPVRFSDLVPCDPIPVSGGECVYSVRVWNGMAGKLEGKAWSMANTALPNSVIGFTNFQVREPHELSLGRGESRVLRFKVQVPAEGVSLETSLCLSLFVGRGGNSFFNTIGFRELFCVFGGANGFAISIPQAKEARPLLPAPGRAMMQANRADTEPNNSCFEAQDLGATAFPFTLDGNLDSSQGPDIDFFRFSGVPGEPILINHEGQLSGKGTLFDPLLGVFDSSCNLITLNDDYTTRNSRVVMVVPPDGVLILAATAFPDIFFTGGGEGTYQLTVSSLEPVGSIRGRVTDAITGAPLPGDVSPYAFVGLLQCDEFGCILVNTQPTASDGSFSFDRDFNGMPLGAGSYRVAAIAQQYQLAETETFAVGEGESLDVGEVPLTPWPILVGDVQTCTIPSEGGSCEYSVRITNPLSTKFSGKAWSLVYGGPLGTLVDFTVFQTDTPVNVRLDPGESQILRFRFRVRGVVPDGASICADVYVGENPHPYFSPVGGAFLFCATKGQDGLTLMSPEEAQKTVWQMQLQRFRPSQFTIEKIK